jgi:cation diffusion facilitator CzcD-associated flavoprotein CzcO
MPPIETRVAIVGAGAAGLSAGAALKHVGQEPVLFDKDEQIGGTWARRYERLHLHTVRRFSGLAHYPIPRTYPGYVPKDMFAAYLEDYADHFGLDVRLGRRVSRVRQQNGRWLVETDDGEWLAEAVVIATGRYNEPRIPDWEGVKAFTGRVIHSADYRSGEEFRGERVLVIGIGNSGAELAADLAEQGASFVAIAVRTPPPIMPRDLFGVVPVQLLGLAFTPVPAPRLLDGAGTVLRRIGTGDLRKYGLAKAEWGPFTARRPAVIDVGFLHELKGGRVHVRPNVSRFTENGVVFEDGREEDFDAVVAATGFSSKLAELLAVPGAVSESGRPRFPSGQPTDFPGLYFVGFDETTRGVLYEANRDSRRLAPAIAEYLRRAA